MALSVNNSVFDFSKITSEISQSVNNIKGKTASLRLEIPNSEVSTSANYVSNFAVPYLEPSVSYSIHKFVSENPNSEQLKKQSQEKNIYKDEEGNLDKINEEIENSFGISFQEELAQSVSKLDFGKIAEIYRNNGNYSTANTIFGQTDAQVSQPEKVAQTYDYVANINAKNRVLIDFMHEFNRNHDLSI